MAASTEVRVPLLDDELVALAGRIPPDLKLRRLTRKYIFKKSMEGVLPKEVIWRPKAGFGAPIRSWLVDDLKPAGRRSSLPRERRRRGPVRAGGGAAADPTQTTPGTEDNALRIWALLTLELWQQTFLDSSG